jgi:hypothetical protein
MQSRRDFFRTLIGLAVATRFGVVAAPRQEFVETAIRNLATLPVPAPGEWMFSGEAIYRTLESHAIRPEA